MELRTAFSLPELLLSFVIVCFGFGFGIGDGQSNFNVVDFGAAGDGKTDDSQAFLKAWGATCGAGGTPTLQIPAGKTFLLQPLCFQGPCKSTGVHVQAQGNIVAPDNPAAWSNCEFGKWIGFTDVSNLIVDGSGQIDGRGASWWSGVHNASPRRIVPLATRKLIQEKTYGPCSDRPTAIFFHNCNNLRVSGITSMNSPRNHISIDNCNGASISNLQLIAPEDSPNTDGIDIAASSQVNVFDSFISTGDDCIAMNDGCNGINITRLTCSPGHGISVGSLGAHGSTEKVEQIRVTDCIFNRTMNGARIKTWAGGSGYAKNIYFENITLIDAGNPIVIDQHYCPHAKGCPPESSGVAITDVKFIGFHGTSSAKEAIKLDCIKAAGCNEVVLENVNITSAAEGTQPSAYCSNVQGSSKATVPPVPCLS